MRYPVKKMKVTSTTTAAMEVRKFIRENVFAKEVVQLLAKDKELRRYLTSGAKLGIDQAIGEVNKKFEQLKADLTNRLDYETDNRLCEEIVFQALTLISENERDVDDDDSEDIFG